MSFVRALEVTRYTRDNKPHATELILEPSWGVLEDHIRAMDRFEKPILWLCQEVANGELNAVAINGGQDVYHVQIASSDGEWLFWVSDSNSSEEVEVLTSDRSGV